MQLSVEVQFRQNSSALVPLPVRVVQEADGAARHGVDRLTQQPVFVLKPTEIHRKKTLCYHTKRCLMQTQTNLPRFVEAPVSRRFNVVEHFLVLRRRRPRRVRSRRSEHQEEGMLRTPVVQEVQGPVRLDRGTRDSGCHVRYRIRYQNKQGALLVFMELCTNITVV